MYAIVDIAGQQFKVEKDQKVYVHRLDAEAGNKVQFDRVLLIDDNGNINIGAPAINGAAVNATVLEHLKGDKVIVFKKKRRKGYKKKNGHRQYLTEIQINDIVASGAKPVAKAEKAAPKAEAKKEDAPKAEVKKETAPKAEAKKEAPKAEAKKEASEDLASMTVAQLKEMAKVKGISGISSMKKADLIDALK
ncbi:MAG: 50S ribosomal protein L21 [Flavobacteriales bacterium]|nr:50S ribosomal protein L21 [Flavobacteriales bacterium]